MIEITPFMAWLIFIPVAVITWVAMIGSIWLVIQILTGRL